MHFVTDTVDEFLKVLFGRDGTNDWAAWATLAGTIFFVLLIRAKRYAKTCIKWGVLILPLILAVGFTIYNLIHPRTGQVELTVAGAALVVALFTFGTAIQAFAKKLIVQIPLLLLAFALAVTVMLDAILNYQTLSISFSLAHTANFCSHAVSVMAAVSAVTLFIAFWVVLIRGIVRKF